MVDEGTTLGDLRGLLEAFAHAMFGAGKRTRFRPGYYPFTEPSVAFDVECLVCGGAGLPGVRPERLDDDPRRRHGPSRSCSATAASTRSATRASPSAWARSASRCSATGSPTCGCSSRTTSASWASSDEGAAVVAARVRRASTSRPEQLAERLTLLGHGGQGHRAARGPTGRTSSSASCSRSRSTRARTGCR